MGFLKDVDSNTKISKMQLVEAYLNSDKFKKIVLELVTRWAKAQSSEPNRSSWSLSDLAQKLNIDESAMNLVASRLLGKEGGDLQFSTADITNLIQKAKDQAGISKET